MKFAKKLPNLSELPSLPNLDRVRSIQLPNSKRFGKRLIFGIAALVIVYIIGGIIVGLQVYKKPTSNAYEKAWVDTLLNIYPFPAAKVNGEYIPVKNVFSRVRYSLKFSSETGQKIDPADALIKRALDQEVEDAIVKQELRRARVMVSQNDINTVFKEDIVAKHGGEQEVKKVLRTLYGMSVNEFKALIAVQIRKDKLQENVIERARVRHIIMADEGKAKSLIQELRDGKRNFPDAAKEFSKDTNSKDNGGLIQSEDPVSKEKVDLIARGFMPTPFDEVVFDKAEIGKVYPDPVKTDFGFHIVLVEERHGTIKLNFQQWIKEAKNNARIKNYL